MPFLDRLGGVFSPVFRPHEALTTQVLTAAVRSLNRLDPQAVVVTGDLADNAQRNELDAARAVLSGGRVHPDSGAAGYAGVQEAGNPDPFYYRPDTDPPRHPGLLAAAQRAYDAPGLDAPWYPVLGNHDLLAQGETPPTPAIQAVATGDRIVESLDPGLRPDSGTDAQAAVAALLEGGLPGRTRAVPPDAARRLLSPAETLRRLGRRGRDGGRLDYTFDIGASVRGIVLDVVDRDGGDRGVVTRAQLDGCRTSCAVPGGATSLSSPTSRSASPTAATRRSAHSTPHRAWSPRSPATATATRSPRAHRGPTGSSKPPRWPTSRSRPGSSASSRRPAAASRSRHGWSTTTARDSPASRASSPSSTRRAVGPGASPAGRPTATPASGCRRRPDSRSSRG